MHTLDYLLPTEDRVVIRPDTAASESKGGLLIPDLAQEKPSRGIVIGVGPGRYEMGQLIPMRLTVGDWVLFGAFSGTPYELNGQPVLVFREMDILATIGTRAMTPAEIDHQTIAAAARDRVHIEDVRPDVGALVNGPTETVPRILAPGRRGPL